MNRAITNPALRTLADRGFIQQCSDLEALDRRMNEGPITFYVGIDPTGPSLHVGHSVPVFAAAHLAQAGHRAILLLGGGTARIGDPSGKTEMRTSLDIEKINENIESIRKQLHSFMERSGAQAAFVNNADWLADLNYIEFLRDIGRHFSVNRMLGFEAYRLRMEQGLSFIEFNYQLLQSYDFLELYRREGCQLQIGGDDQWGNIVAGADLIRRVEGHEKMSFALTFPLILTSDGKKMGKTARGALFLDADITPPFEFFQYWRNVNDNDVIRFLKLFTFLPAEDIRKMEAQIDEGQNSPTGSTGQNSSTGSTGQNSPTGSTGASSINELKELLAHEVTALVHGRQTADAVLASARAAFGGGMGAGAGAAVGSGAGTGAGAQAGVGAGAQAGAGVGAGTGVGVAAPVAGTSAGAQSKEQLNAMPTLRISAEELESGIGFLELLARSGLCSSRAEARRLVQQGGAQLNNRKIEDIEFIVTPRERGPNGIILRAGKKRYTRVLVEATGAR
ncbi:MAG: tyrosine--tRNA ligase [Salinispira sp.]